MIAVWLIVLLSFAGCHTNSESPGVGEGYLRVADKDDVPTLDPARGYDTASWQYEDLIFETLLDYTDDGRLVGELASEWWANEERTAFGFRLRDTASFSIGRRVEPADVAYALSRVLAPRTGSPGRDFFLTIQGAGKCEQPGCAIPGMEIQPPRTLVIHLDEPDPLFPHKIALPFAAAVPPEIVSQRGEDFGLQPVGSGPFVLAERVPGQRLLFQRNKYYKGPLSVQLEGIVRFVGVSDDLAWMRYRFGLLDLAAIPLAEFPVVIRDASIAPLLRSGDTLRTQYVGLNCRRGPLADRRVRQALNYAVDREKLLRLLNGRGAAARGVIPPTMPNYPEREPIYPLDRAKARALLTEAGYGAGFEATLWLRNDDTAMRVAQSLQQDWATIGVRVRLKPLAWGPFLDAVRHNPSVDLFLLGWEADFPDPSNFLEVLFHSRQIGVNNHTNYANPVVDTLLDRAARTLDEQTRIALYREVETLLVEDAPWVFLYHPRSFLVVSERVDNFRLHPWRPPRLAQVRLMGAQSRGSRGGRGDNSP